MSVIRRLAELRLALALLTRLPVGRIEPCPPMGAAVWAFPLAGLVPGLAGGLTLWAAASAGLPSMVAGLLAVAAAAWITGGLHEDGLADLTDGLSGGHTPERRLEIMRDSRIGSHGALALILAVGLKAAAMASLEGRATLTVPIAAAMISRAGLGVVMLTLPPARRIGLGTEAAQGVTPIRAGAGMAIGAAAALMLGPPGAVAFLFAGAAAIVIADMARRRLGGFTGDVLGAIQTTAEIATLVALCRT